MRPLEQALRRGVDALALDLNDSQISHLLDYLDLIQKWTKVYNLTSVRDPAEMLTHHLLDSLAVIKPLRRQLDAARAGSPEPHPGEAGQGMAPVPARSGRPIRLLDVGSGAGLPGIVIAICCPEVLVDCVDTVAKKAAFIRQVAATLRLPNLRGLHARVESLSEKYEMISSRAFASLLDFTTWSAAALAGQGVWLAMKGKHPAEEIAALPATVEVFHVEQLTVPGLDAERCILWLRQK
jgi:16S rRNA (guanine527-N7)-methyltransferase